MTGKTHRVGGMIWVLGGFTYLESKGLLLRNVNPLLQLTVMYPFALYGSIVSDLDHNANSIPSKDIVSVAINRVLHLTSGLKETGAIVINTTKSADYLKDVLKGYKGNVYTIDARKISEEALGRYFPNTPMLAAIVKVSGIMSDEAFLEDMKSSFKHIFAIKPVVIDLNMKALEMALKEVKKI